MSLPALISCCAIIFAVLAFAVIPIIIGAVQKRRVLKPVEYFPPKGASPIDVLIEYYGSSADPRQLFNPLMLYWAERGFITIEEDCKRGLKLTKINGILPPEGEYNPITFNLESRLFHRIFSGGNVFYSLSAYSSFATFYEEIMEKCRKSANSVNDGKSKILSICSTILAFALIIAVTLIVGLSIGEGYIIAMLFPIIGMIFVRFARQDAPKGSTFRFFLYPFFGVWSGVPFLLIVSSLPLDCALVIISAFAVCALILFLLSNKIDLRTKEHLITYAKIEAFKRYLLLAEIKELEMMVEEDPRYYYKILPYCYILKLTKKLKPKFDRIILDGPGWYLGELRETLMF